MTTQYAIETCVSKSALDLTRSCLGSESHSLRQHTRSGRTRSQKREYQLLHSTVDRATEEGAIQVSDIETAVRRAVDQVKAPCFNAVNISTELLAAYPGINSFSAEEVLEIHIARAVITTLGAVAVVARRFRTKESLSQMTFDKCLNNQQLLEKIAKYLGSLYMQNASEANREKILKKGVNELENAIIRRISGKDAQNSTSERSMASTAIQLDRSIGLKLFAMYH